VEDDGAGGEHFGEGDVVGGDEHGLRESGKDYGKGAFAARVKNAPKSSKDCGGNPPMLVFPQAAKTTKMLDIPPER
jgi:hypothetical protein